MIRKPHFEQPKHIILAVIGGLISGLTLFALTFPDALHNTFENLSASVAWPNIDTSSIAGQFYYYSTNSTLKVYSNTDLDWLEYIEVKLSFKPDLEILLNNPNNAEIEPMSPTMKSYTIKKQTITKWDLVAEFHFNNGTKEDLSVGQISTLSNDAKFADYEITNANT